MAFAVFSDIHGNLEALEAIIKHARKKTKEMYFLGDAIVFGPNSSECLKLLKKYNVKCVLGNHEQRIITYGRAAKTYATQEHLKYVFNHLDAEDIAFIKGMPTSLKINYKGVNIMFLHYAHDDEGAVRDDFEPFTESKLEELFGGYRCDVVFFGHIHKRKIIIEESGRSFICNGASGCVKGNQTFYTYFDVDKDDGGVNFDIRRINVPFNRKKFDEKFIATPLPDKDSYKELVFGIK